MALMSKSGWIMLGSLVGAVFGYLLGVIVFLVTDWNHNRVVRQLGGWAPVCGILAGAYVGGVVGYFAAVRKRSSAGKDE